MNEELLRRLAACERRNRILVVTNVAIVALFAIAACRTTTLNDPKPPQSMTVSELNVVDHNGVIRAKLAGDFPDPIIQGQRRSRQSPAGGLLLFDDRGHERGSFATFKSGYVGMTLDSDTTMMTTLVTAREGGSGLRMMYGNDAVDIRADDDGPHLHVMRAKQVAFHAPAELNPSAMPMCGELRGAIGKASREQILDACRERASEEACQVCVGK